MDVPFGAIMTLCPILVQNGGLWVFATKRYYLASSRVEFNIPSVRKRFTNT